MADARLGVLINAKDETKAAVASVNAGIRSVAATAGAVNQQVGSVGSSIASMLTSGPGAAFAALGVSMGAMQLGSAVVDMAKTATQVGVLRDSLEGLAATAGTTGDAIVSSLQRASGGAISEQSLILAANRSMLLGVADSAEEMGALMEVAIVRGRAMGLSAEQAFSDLVTGIGRMSPLILDNLGIVTGGEKVFDDYAAALGRTADQLTDVERKQALVNTVISSSASLVAQAGDISQSVSQFDRLTVSVESFKLALGEAFAPSVISLAKSLADTLNDITEAMAKADTPRSQAATANRWGIEGIDTSEAGVTARGIAQEVAAEIDSINSEMASLQESISIMRSALGNLVPGDTGFDELNSKIKEAEGLLRGLQSRLVATSSEAHIPSNSYWDFVRATEAAQQGAGAFKDATQQLSATEIQTAQAAVEAANKLGYLGAIALSQVGAIGALDNAVNNLNATLSGLQNRWAGMSGIFAGLDGLKQSAISKLESQALEAVRSGASPDAIAEMYDQASDAIFNLSLSTEASASAQLKNKIAVDQAVQSEGSRIAAIQQSLDTQNAYIDSFNQLNQSAARAGASIASGLVPSIGEDAALGKAQEFTAELQGQIDLWLQAKKSPDEIANVLMPAYLDKLREANTLATAHGSAVADINAGWDDLKGKVQGVVSEALNLDVGISPDDFLPREDAVNENARRLAAIMRDGLVGQPWLEEFKAEVPALFAELAASDDPKQAAANMLKQFESGMRPELIDKGKAKEIVRNMLLGEAATGALVDEIAGELASELGISIERAKAAAGATLGVPTEMEPISRQLAPPEPVIVPVSFSTGEGLETSITTVTANFVAGVESANVGTRVATQITAQLSGSASLASFKNAGTSAAGTWGEAFLGRVSESVPGALIDMLVSLITPEVQARQQQAATQTGAAV